MISNRGGDCSKFYYKKFLRSKDKGLWKDGHGRNEKK